MSETYDNVHMYIILTATYPLVGVNGTVYVEKENKQVIKRGYQMLDRTWKGVGHGRYREVGDGRRGIRRGEMGKVLPFNI